jgi:hypothetical protein
LRAPAEENWSERVVGISSPFGDLSKLLNSRRGTAVAECENVTGRHRYHESVGRKVVQTTVPQFVDENHTRLEIASHKHGKDLAVLHHPDFRLGELSQILHGAAMQLMLVYSGCHQMMTRYILKTISLIHEIGGEQTVPKVPDHGGI